MELSNQFDKRIFSKTKIIKTHSKRKSSHLYEDSVNVQLLNYQSENNNKEKKPKLANEKDNSTKVTNIISAVHSNTAVNKNTANSQNSTNIDFNDNNRCIVIVDAKVNKNSPVALKKKKHLSSKTLAEKDNLIKTKTANSKILQSEETSCNIVSSLSSNNNSLNSISGQVNENATITKLINQSNLKIYSKKEIKDRHEKEAIQVNKNYSIDEKIHSRYQQYWLLEAKLKDQNKTDYTYAHSFSYSPLVPVNEQYNWMVPNMSRQSIHHQPVQSLFEQKQVTRRFVGNLPISQINENNVNTRINEKKGNSIERYALRNHNSVLHSTPISYSTTTSTTTYKSNAAEFSDDDLNDSNETVYFQPLVRKTASTLGRSNTYILRSAGQFDSADEDHWTLNRRIRYMLTFIKNKFMSNFPSYNNTSDDINALNNDNNIPLQSSFDNNRLDSTAIYRKNHHQQMDSSKNEVASNSGLLLSFFNIFGKNIDTVHGKNKKSAIWCRVWPLCWLLLLSLLLLIPLLGYFFGSSPYKLLVSNENSKLLPLHLAPSSSTLSTLLTSLISIISWPQFLFYKLWLFLSPPTISSSIPPTHIYNNNNQQDLLQLTNELLSLKEELIVMKNRNSDPVLLPSPPLSDIDQLLKRIERLELELKSCCRATWNDSLDNHVQVLINSRIDDINQHYDSKLKMESKNIESYLLRFVAEHFAQLNDSLVNQLSSTQYSVSNFSTVSSVNVEKLIQKAIAKYDADKTGETDFALESSGAWIIGTRCTERYDFYPAIYTLGSLPLWRSTTSARVVIQPGVVPGECYCFKGSEGRISIHLSATIIPIAVTYEHIPLRLSRDGTIKSAPKRFVIYGLRTEDDPEPISLGEYDYEISNDDEQLPLKRFPIQNIKAAKYTFNMVEMVVKSNHGHPDYTCLYRLRVHGTLPNV